MTQTDERAGLAGVGMLLAWVFSAVAFAVLEWNGHLKLGLIAAAASFAAVGVASGGFLFRKHR